MRAYRRKRLGQVQTVRPFNSAEDEFITEMRIKGAGTTEIARALFAAQGSLRTQATINMRLKSLAAQDEGQYD